MVSTFKMLLGAAIPDKTFYSAACLMNAAICNDKTNPPDEALSFYTNGVHF